MTGVSNQNGRNSASAPPTSIAVACTALGKVLLAHRSWPEVRTLIERHGWRPYTPHSIQEFDRLEADLAGIRERGYGQDDQERAIGSACLAAPIRDHAGQVAAALSVTGTTGTLPPQRRAEVLPRVLAAANRVSLRLGHHDTLAYA
ncbi:MAG: hypothetical protein M3Q10_09130 [Chloroflexota bacterium]|nr:hypothetical protein [Chloroflexota bacterium]